MKIIDDLRENVLLSTEMSKLEARLWTMVRRSGLKSVLVTSAVRGEGKSTTVAYLATSLGLYPKRKILVMDFDFRIPQQGEYFEQRARVGIDKVLAGEASLDDAILKTKLPGLDLLLPSHGGADPVLLLESERLRDMIQQLTKRYDLIVLDSPAMIPVADATMLIPEVDGVLLVAMSGKTTEPHLRRVRDLCAGLEANVLGLVIGNLQQAAPEYMVDDNGYYGSYGKSKSSAKKSRKPAKN